MKWHVVRLALAWVMAVPAPAQEQRVSAWLESALRQARPDDRQIVWIYFRDKGSGAVERLISSAPARTAARRARRGTATARSAFEDAPLERSYVERIRRHVSRVRHESRWLNAVSAEATAAQVRAIAALPMVARVDLVKRYRRTRREPFEALDGAGRRPPAARHRRGSAALLDYGTSLEQVAQIRVPELHDRGLSGAGVVVAVFDSGFPHLSHEAFGRMTIVAERDFVAALDTVRGSTDAHGMATLSALGGMHEGQLVGPAYGAAFMLAVTEDARSETPVEEDNWAAAVEWAERGGADVISSSLGYLEFDLPFTSYTERDMDGETAITTKAAAMAAARGVVVVNSAGNGGFRPDRNTLGAPADGKHVIAVGAVDQTGARAAFSSVGPTTDGRIKPDVSARGVRVKVASVAGATAYALASGTSFSCPLTAGVVALLLQAHPMYTPDQVLFALRSTASQNGAPDNLLGWGIVDAVGAVDAAVPPVPSEAPRFALGIVH